jgi:N-hydroxyarylamine O-acetyltransferase
VLDTASQARHRQFVIDLDAYFARIGYRGSRSATLETLNAIVSAHVQTIPFENLDVLLGRRIELEPSALERKLVHGRRGGYCFEQNSLLLAVLGDLGFDVHPLSARVRYQRPRDYTPARTHLFVRVELAESWLVDVGVGAMSVTSALRLDTADVQPTPHEPRRILREGKLLYHQVRLGDDWNDICEFTLEEMPPIDREVANWFTSTHPASHFKNRLLVARALPDGGRLGLLNRDLTVRRRDGRAEAHTVQSPDELLTVLAERFGLAFPPQTRFTCEALDWPT